MLFLFFLLNLDPQQYMKQVNEREKPEELQVWGFNLTLGPVA